MSELDPRPSDLVKGLSTGWFRKILSDEIVDALERHMHWKDMCLLVFGDIDI